MKGELTKKYALFFDERGEIMNEYDIQVDLKHGLVFHNQIDLVQNDYNSTIFNFKFNDKDYSNYTKIFQLEYPDGKTWIKEIKEDKITLADLNEENIYVPILIQSGKYYFDIAIYDENSKLTTTKKSYFKVREKISGENIELDDRLPILDDLINSSTKNIIETNNLDIELEGSILTITKKDGTVKSEDVRGPQGFIAFEELTPEQKEELRGPQGLTATIEVGTIETLGPNQMAEVINSGNEHEAIFDFRLPRGEKGDTYEITDEDYEEIEEQVKTDIQPLLNDINETSDNALEVAKTAESIARGKSQSIVFETFEELEVWIKDETNKGIASKGDNLYIKQMWIDEEAGIRQPDYWITEVLDEPNELGYYYEISDLGVEHPDLTNLLSKDEIGEKYLLITYADKTTETIKLVVYK